jgi:membrane associated rhomboid family serine protease
MPQSEAPAAHRSLRSNAQRAAVAMGLFVALLWIVQVIDSLSGYPLLRYGIEPRTPGRLEYVFTAPFIHVSYAHLIGNTLPLAVLGFLVALRGIGRFLAVTAIVICVSGLGVWLFAPSASDTVGASGVIFGYLGYLVASGIFERRFVDLAVAVLVGILYWSFIPDLLPGHPGISWQGHLFGLIGGVLAAWAFRSRPAEVGARTTGSASA